MKIVVTFFVIALIMCFSLGINAATFSEEGNCKPGETWTAPGCIRKHCSDDGKHISGASCGSVSCSPPLILKDGDESKSYPHCCPTCGFD